jgi:hypothetical protein
MLFISLEIYIYKLFHVSNFVLLFKAVHIISYHLKNLNNVTTYYYICKI